jgi:hypothetical protein
MTKSISNISDVATEETNIIGTLDSILTIQAEDGTELVFRNFVERGQQTRGIPIYAELYDSNGDPLPQDTRIALEFEQPADDNPTVVSEPLENIRAYNSLDLQDQQNTDYVDRIKHVLKGRELVVGDNDEFSVSIECSEEIDWSTSRLQFAEDAVTEV